MDNSRFNGKRLKVHTTALSYQMGINSLLASLLQLFREDNKFVAFMSLCPIPLCYQVFFE